jgi:hypothetical protein
MRLDHRHGKQGKQRHETYVVQFEKFVGREQKQGPLNGESFWFGQPMKGECRTSWAMRETEPEKRRHHMVHSIQSFGHEPIINLLLDRGGLLGPWKLK